MLVFHARGADNGVVGDLRQDSPVDLQFAQQVPQLLRGDAAGTEQTGLFSRQIDDGGFHPHLTGAAVDDGVDPAAGAVVVEDVGGGGGGGLAGEIGGGSGDGNACRTDQLTGHLCLGTADGHRGKPCRGPFWDTGLYRQHHSQRPRPEAFGQTPGCLGNIMAVSCQLFCAGDMDDERVVLGTALGEKDFRHRLLIHGVGAQTVDRLRRDGDQAACADDLRRLGDGCGVAGRKNQSFHCASPLSRSFSAWSALTNASMSSSRSPFITASSL